MGYSHQHLVIYCSVSVVACAFLLIFAITFTTSTCVCVGEKTTFSLFPDHIHKKTTKIFIPLKHIKFNVIFYKWEVIKTPHKLLKTSTIGTTELSLLTTYKVPKKIATRRFWILLVPDSFNLYFILFYILNVLSLPLWTYTNMVITKHWPKFKNFIVIDSEILSMKS